MVEPLSKTYKIDQFISLAKGEGLAKHNRFGVFFSYPQQLQKEISNEDIRKVLLFCESVNIPGHQYYNTPILTYGERRAAVYEKNYQPINMTFYVDANMRVKYLFDDWAKSIQNPETRRFNYYNDYTTEIHIIVYNVEENETYRVVCYECFPIEMGMVSMDNNARDIMKLQIVMQIKYWSSTPIQHVSDVNTFVPSPGLLGFYRKDFDIFQEGFNVFDQGLTSVENTIHRGLPGLTGHLPDVQGFISGANNFVSRGVHSKNRPDGFIDAARSSFNAFN